MNSCLGEIRCKAENARPQIKELSASAIAAITQGGFFRVLMF
jgi:hypothetical protein